MTLHCLVSIECRMWFKFHLTHHSLLIKWPNTVIIKGLERKTFTFFRDKDLAKNSPKWLYVIRTNGFSSYMLFEITFDLLDIVKSIYMIVCLALVIERTWFNLCSFKLMKTIWKNQRFLQKKKQITWIESDFAYLKTFQSFSCALYSYWMLKCRINTI